MAQKITMNGQSHKSVAEVYEDFVISQTAQGLTEVTITNYRRHFHSISRHFDIEQPMDALTKSKLEAMVVSMRQSGLAHNSISSYCRASTIRNIQNRDVDLDTKQIVFRHNENGKIQTVPLCSLMVSYKKLLTNALNGCIIWVR